jgi:chromosomal replication initiation ATPase DnaA
MSHRVADRLIAARRRQFVGRTGERALFQSALAASELPFLVLYVYGPGGVGKTSLLREFIDICAQMNVPSIYLDARNFEPSADAFLNTLRRTLGLHPDEAPEQALAGARRQVVLIDTYERLAPWTTGCGKVSCRSCPRTCW